ncbi:MAG: ribonuclease HI [Bacteriovoracaceae bacterium]|nr:ribonuclease HI [Bacteriovoracaceae bacterium]
MKIKKKLSKAVSDLKKHLPSDGKMAEVLAFIEEQISLLEENETNSSDEKSFPVPSELALGEFALFSDGACRGNPGPGSWAMMMQASSGEVLVAEAAVEEQTTNNRMELTGAIKCLEYFYDYSQKNKNNGRAWLFTDSRYVVDGISKWVPQWKERGWKKADNKAPENIDLWQQLDEAYRKVSVNFRWVKGHAGHPQNEYCDQLANEALDNDGF